MRVIILLLVFALAAEGGRARKTRANVRKPAPEAESSAIHGSYAYRYAEMLISEHDRALERYAKANADLDSAECEESPERAKLVRERELASLELENRKHALAAEAERLERMAADDNRGAWKSERDLSKARSILSDAKRSLSQGSEIASRRGGDQ